MPSRRNDLSDSEILAPLFRAIANILPKAENSDDWSNEGLLPTAPGVHSRREVI